MIASWDRRLAALAAVVLIALAGIASDGRAETERKGLFKGMSQKSEGPVRISAATLEVRDKSKMATFSGNVHVIQGETEVTCNTLVVYYEDDRGKEKAKAKAKSTDPTARGNQQIRRMEARGSVTVKQKDQRAVGDRADVDMRTKVLTLSGNVVVTNSENTLRGQRLVVYLDTGVLRMESNGGGGRVEGLLNPTSQPKLNK